ncbi:hypothetical protein E0L36_13865 [Streptomyces sp. AJS327]|uniref:hypothetical protein n=1 Tax=Streptomyces sp. AJS327 TaxID=2545265 RepID=UPI0015DD768F|nr:hypothetical protein [Streptomyces sp. AJS327]MBA0051942.1 hypothetical protein [Streptomyces sp. AJS327]
MTAAETAAGIQGGQVLGTLGAGGAALAITVFLITGIKGKHKLKLDADQAAIAGFIAGVLYGAAASVWSTAESVSLGLAQAVKGAGVGNVGMGAVALVLVIVIYGVKLKPRTAALAGIAAASIFAAAGGIWAVLSTTVAHGLNTVLT